MDRLLRSFLGQFVRRGSMIVTTASGEKFVCGDGTGDPVSVRFTTTQTERRILINPELALGEAYMDGTFVVEHGDIADVLAILLDQPDMLPRWAKPQWWMRYLIRHVQQFNPPRTRQRQCRAPLRSSTAGSIRCFWTPTSNIAAPISRRRTPLSTMPNWPRSVISPPKLLIGRGARVLDIGCGWGGLGLYLAEMTGADVTGITLSTEQLQFANARAAEKNLTRSARFLLQDYRDVTGPFDRIVSVGMFEHVGVDFYETYFQRCAELLTDDGVMMLHSIGRSHRS